MYQQSNILFLFQYYKRKNLLTKKFNSSHYAFMPPPSISEPWADPGPTILSRAPTSRQRLQFWILHRRSSYGCCKTQQQLCRHFVWRDAFLMSGAKLDVSTIMRALAQGDQTHIFKIRTFGAKKEDFYKKRRTTLKIQMYFFNTLFYISLHII